MSLGVVLATCIGAVAFQPVVPAVLQDMGQPEKFPRAMLAAVVTCGCLYLAVMLCGYHGYGAFILQDIVQSMTHSPKDVQEAFDDEAEAWNWTGAKSLWVPALVSSLVLVNIVLSMPIIMMAVFYSAQESKALAPHVKPGSWANWVMRATLVTIAVVIAMCVPRFTLVFGFFCAVAGPAVGLAFPLLFSGAVLRRCGVAQRWWRHGLHGLIILLSILCMGLEKTVQGQGMCFFQVGATVFDCVGSGPVCCELAHASMAAHGTNKIPAWCCDLWQRSTIENFVEYYALGRLAQQWSGLNIRETRRRQAKLRERWESAGPFKIWFDAWQLLDGRGRLHVLAKTLDYDRLFGLAMLQAVYGFQRGPLDSMD
eukprot:s2744_g4.t1